MTKTPILDESAVSEIEARYQNATPGPWGVLPSNNSTLAHVETQEGTAAEQGQGFTVCGIPKKRIDDAEFIARAREDIPALCATVKHLRAKYEQLALASGEWASLLDRIRAWSKCSDGYPLDEHINNITIERERLQSQLEQLRAELAEEKRLRAELKQIAQSGISEVSSLGATLKDNALIDFRSRAIQLCKDKATGYNRELGSLQRDDDPSYYTLVLSLRETMNQLAAELEKL